MLKAYLWLIVLHFAINSHVIAASDDREHVHIKVHMPKVLRKHNHYHKVQKYLHHHHQQPRQRPPKKVLHHQPIDAELLYGHDNVVQQFFPAPYQMPVLPEPELVADEDDYETDIMSAAAFEGDATTFPQPYRPTVQPPALHTTQVPQLRQQLMQQLFSPEIMSALTSGGGMTSGVAGGGVGTDTNSLMANDFLAELRKEYAKKMQEQKILPVKLKQTKKQKRKKYSSKNRYQQGQEQEDRYQPDQQDQQQPQAQQQQFYSQQQPLYNSNFPRNNNIFEAFLQPFSQYQQQQQQHQHRQQIQQDFDDDLDEMMDEEFDDKTSSEDLGGESYQDMYAAYTQTTPMQPPTTTPTRSKWWPYQQQQQFQPKLQDSFNLPLVPLSRSTASTRTTAILGTGGLGNRFETGYKTRKNRVKLKRNRIVVL